MHIPKIGVEEGVGIAHTVQRAYQLEWERFPERSRADWAEAIRKDKAGVSQIFEKPNMVMDEPMIIQASYFLGQQQPWQTMRWYKQAIGCGATAPARGQTDLVHELFRAGFTESSRNGKQTYALTIYASTDFQPLSTTVTSVVSSSQFNVGAVTDLKPNDLIRVLLPTNYEYAVVLTVVGNTVTLAAPLSMAPLIGATVDQVVEEAGLFGNEPAGIVTGTATFTNGSDVVTFTGVTIEERVAAGDKIRLKSSTKWYEIESVVGNSITLTTNYAEATASGQVFEIRGTMFNRVTAIRFVKELTKGFAFETQWLTGGT